MKKGLAVFLIFLIAGLCSCQSNTNPILYFFITNSSESKKTVDLKLEINGETLFDQYIKYSSIQPDLQYSPYKQLQKGDYTIKVIADSGKVVSLRSIKLDSDKWIFIDYGFVAEADSATKVQWRQENRELLKSEPDYLPEHLKYSAPRIIIYVMNNQPIQQ